MLEFEPSKRVRSRKLYQTLAQYENKILDLEPFQVPQQIPQGYSTPYNNANNGYYNKPYGVPTNNYQYPTQGHQFVQHSPQNPNATNIRINEHVPTYVKRP